jgi:peptidoglycan hydrolase CwlO-like protein
MTEKFKSLGNFGSWLQGLIAAILVLGSVFYSIVSIANKVETLNKDKAEKSEVESVKSDFEKKIIKMDGSLERIEDFIKDIKEENKRNRR